MTPYTLTSDAIRAPSVAIDSEPDPNRRLVVELVALRVPGHLMLKQHEFGVLRKDDLLAHARDWEVGWPEENRGMLRSWEDETRCNSHSAC